MNVSFIYFDNDLDIAPGPNEEFTYKPGDNFIMHWDTSTPPPENYPYKHILLRMYNVSYIREIDFAHHLPVLHPNKTTNQEPIPIPGTINPYNIIVGTTELRHSSSPNDSIQTPQRNYPNGSDEQQDIIDDPTPLPPKLNEICICEDTPDPTCPVHRGRNTF